MSKKKKKRREKNQIQYFDYGLLIIVIMLLAFGLVMLYSTSAYNATLRFDDPTHYVKRQLAAMAIGFVGMGFFIKVNYRVWRVFTYPLCIGAFALCVLVIFAGNAKYGQSRWFSVAGINVQPSEIAKIAVILLMAMMCQRFYRDFKGLTIIKLFVGLAIYCAPILYNNMSTAVIIMGIAFIMVFVASPELKTFVALAFLAFAGGVAVIAFGQGYRSTRIDVWKNPELYDEGYQTLQGLYAIGSGGLFGKGLGESFQKGFVPEAQNDMIFSIICEELGIFGAICVIVIYILLLWRLMIIAINAKERYGSFLCIGIMAHLALQVILNIGVVTNTIPNTGITLPFISYGGSALVILMSEMGLALSVSKGIEPK
ncbi:MAG: putative lipid II flippase FtsW [Lachnospiraceae bacterium]|nr:putative lipid II flippase FtsW [Lachnospiraceae bacterium]